LFQLKSAAREPHDSADSLKPNSLRQPARRRGSSWAPSPLRSSRHQGYRATPRKVKESPGLALGIIAVESSLPGAFLYQRKHRVDRWCCDFDEAADFLDGGDECIDLKGSTTFEILQH